MPPGEQPVMRTVGWGCGGAAIGRGWGDGLSWEGVRIYTVLCSM